MASPMKRKRPQSQGESKRKPPAGLGGSDDQGPSELCVRFSVAKAIASHLYLHKDPKIDIDQKQIRTSLVQAIGNKTRRNSGQKFKLDVCSPLDCNGVSLLLQDVENSSETIPNKSWWEVRFLLYRNY